MAHHIRNPGPVIHLSVPFDGRFEDIKMAAYLHAALVNIGIGYLAASCGGNGYNRAPLCLGAHHTGNKVGRTRSCACHHYCRISGDAGIGITGMGCCSFMARHNELYAQFISQTLYGFDHHHVGSVSNGIDITHTLGMQTPQ